MAYEAWLKYICSAEKTSIISGQIRKIHYKFPDGNEMAEEYSMETGIVLRRAWKKKKKLMGEPEWEIELGEIPKIPNDNNFLVRESNTEPTLSKRITKRNIEWRIRNLPYPIETYSVGPDNDKKSIIVRTTNKKYYKTIPIPELERCGIKVDQANISLNHQYNTLIITYKKPEVLCDMEKKILIELKNVETESDMSELFKGLMQS